MRFQGWALRAALAAIVASTCVPAIGRASAPVDWVFASMTVSGGAATPMPREGFSIGGPGGPGQSASLTVLISAHSTGTGPVLVGDGAGFGSGLSFVAVDDFATGGSRLRTTNDLGGFDVEITPVKDGSFTILSDVGGSAPSFVNLVFLTNAVIDRYTVKGSHGTPVYEVGSGSRVIEMAGPEASGIAVDASVAAVGASTFDTVTSKGIVGGVAWGSCVQCTVNWTGPGGKSGTVTQTSTPFVPLPIPVPLPLGGTIQGDDTFVGPAGAWSWSWTGANARTEPSPTIVGAYAPIGDLWKDFVGQSGGAAAPLRPAPAPERQSKVLETKQTNRHLASTGAGPIIWGWILLLGAVVLGTRCFSFR